MLTRITALKNELDTFRPFGPKLLPKSRPKEERRMEFLDQCSDLFIKLIAYGILFAIGFTILAMALKIILQGICDVCYLVTFLCSVVWGTLTALYRVLRYSFTVLRQVYRTRTRCRSRSLNQFP